MTLCVISYFPGNRININLLRNRVNPYQKTLFLSNFRSKQLQITTTIEDEHKSAKQSRRLIQENQQGYTEGLEKQNQR